MLVPSLILQFSTSLSTARTPCGQRLRVQKRMATHLVSGTIRRAFVDSTSCVCYGSEGPKNFVALRGKRHLFVHDSRTDRPRKYSRANGLGCPRSYWNPSPVFHHLLEHDFSKTRLLRPYPS